jgi:hypothetical protein
MKALMGEVEKETKKTMSELIVLRDRFLESLTNLESIREDMFVSLSDLSTPYTSRPTRRRSSSDAEDRSTQLKSLVLRFKGDLLKFREKLENSEPWIGTCPPAACTAGGGASAGAGTVYQEMIDVIDDARNRQIASHNGAESFEPSLLAPDLIPLDDCHKIAVRSRTEIVRTRLESSMTLFQTIARDSREMGHYLWGSTEASCDTQTTLTNVLMKTFHRELACLSESIRHFFKEKTSVDSKKHRIYLDHQKAIALDRQTNNYKKMLESVRAQTTLFKDMITCLDDEIDKITNSIERGRVKKLLNELKKKNEAILIQAEIYYAASHNVVMLQSPSTVFYKSIRYWLHEYQSCLIGTLARIIGGASSPSPPSSSEIAGGVKGGTGSTPLRVENTALYNFAKKVDPTRLADLASTAQFMQPSSATINDILFGFNHCYLNDNKQNTMVLRQKIGKLDLDYEILKRHVIQMRTARQQQHGTFGASSASGEVVKDLLKLNKELKISEGRLQDQYDNLFSAKQAYAQLELQNEKIARIIKYLKEYNTTMTNWEAHIKQEQQFIREWKEVRKSASWDIATELVGWNRLVGGDIDIFYEVIGGFATCTIDGIREKANELLTLIQHVCNLRNTKLESELDLIKQNAEEIRQQSHVAIVPAGTAVSYHPADVVLNTYADFSRWIDRTTYLYHIYFEQRLKSVLGFYLSAIESILNDLTEESQFGILLKTLDAMSNLCSDSVDEISEMKESKRSRTLIDATVTRAFGQL